MKKRFKTLSACFLTVGLSLIALAGEQTMPLPGVYKPYAITVGNGRVYVTETTTVHAYSLTTFKKIKSFGKGGEGPQEFRGRIFKIDIHADSIGVNSVGRLSYYTPDGDFISQQDTAASNVNYKAIGGKFVGMKLKVVERTLHFSINLYNKKLGVIKQLYTFKHPFQRRGYIDPTNVRVCSYHIHQDHIYIDHSDGTIGVYTPEGELTRRIKFAIKRVKITATLQQRYLNFWKTSRQMAAEYQAFKDRLRFPSHFAPIRDFKISNDRIYVLTHIEKNLNNELVVLDTSGKELRRVWVPLAEVDMLIPQAYNFYTISNNSLFVLAENPQTEEWELRWSSLGN